MIRQAISCDICGTEMLNANHWFVANDRGPELRISAWSTRSRTRAGVRHLCGHKCLHKLLDDFTAKTLGVRASSPTDAENAVTRTPTPNDATLAWVAPRRTQPLPIIGSCVDDCESSARLIKPSEQALSRGAFDPTALRSAAWQREQERQRLAEQGAPSRRSIAC